MNTIEKVVVNPYCYLSKLGFHTITIYYKNSINTTENLADNTIVLKYWDYMEFNCKRHFLYLLGN
jgi:hypothetical protein